MPTHLDNTTQPVLTVNAQGLLCQANASAARELGRSRCLALHAQHINATFNPDHPVLMTALHKAAGGIRSLIRLRMHGGSSPHHELLVIVAPLSSAEPDSAPLITLQLERSALIDPSVLALVAQSYELTPCEERVLGLLCEGQDAAEIALSLNVAVSTIRSHVMAIRTKTATNSVRQLVQRMACLPAVGGKSP